MSFRDLSNKDLINQVASLFVNLVGGWRLIIAKSGFKTSKQSSLVVISQADQSSYLSPTGKVDILISARAANSNP